MSEHLWYIIIYSWGTWWRSWLRHCAISRYVAGLIPDGAIGIFHWHNPFSCTMALGLTQPVTEVSTRNIPLGVKAAGAWGWRPYHLHVPTVWKCGSLNLLEPSRPVQACNGIALPLYIPSEILYLKGQEKIFLWIVVWCLVNRICWLLSYILPVTYVIVIINNTDSF